MSQFFKRVVSLSRTPTQTQRQPTESVPPSVSGAGTDYRETFRSLPPAETVPPAETAPHLETVPPADSQPRASVPPTTSIPPTDSRRSIRPRFAASVQDGHSHAEQAVYSALWEIGAADERGNRVVTIGLGKLSRIARLSENNCRINIRSLIRKLAIEQLEDEDSRNSIGKTYLIRNCPEILERRKAAGMEWVVRTKGVAFVRQDGHPLESVPPVVSIPPTESVPASDSVPRTEPNPGTDSKPGTDSAGDTQSDPGTHSGPLSPVSPPSASLIANAAWRFEVVLDDEIVARMRKACKLNDPAANDEEIAYMLGGKLEQIRSAGPLPENLPHLLVKAVANLFPSNELQRLRTKRGRDLEQQGGESPNRHQA